MHTHFLLKMLLHHQITFCTSWILVIMKWYLKTWIAGSQNLNVLVRCDQVSVWLKFTSTGLTDKKQYRNTQLLSSTSYWVHFFLPPVFQGMDKSVLLSHWHGFVLWFCNSCWACQTVNHCSLWITKVFVGKFVKTKEKE